MTTRLHVDIHVPTEIHMTRTFAAPRRLLVKAMSTPELIKKWLGGKRARVVSAEVDFRVGGRYRYAFETHQGGMKFAFVGTFREIGPDRVVHTESFEGMPGESVVTTTWLEDGGQTTMKVVMAFPSKELRDQVLATGMNEGAAESYDVLENLVATLEAA